MTRTTVHPRVLALTLVFSFGCGDRTIDGSNADAGTSTSTSESGDGDGDSGASLGIDGDGDSVPSCNLGEQGGGCESDAACQPGL